MSKLCIRAVLCKKYVCVGMLLLILVLMYMAVFQPLVGQLLFSPKIYSGTELYDDGQYVAYEYGNLFQKALSKLPSVETGQAKFFAYYDHWKRDNLFYGDFCDAYIVDLYFNEQYDAIKDYVQYSGEEFLDGEISYYWIQDAIDSQLHCFIVIPYNEGNIIRCVLITDYANTRGDAMAAGSTLFRNFPIDLQEVPKYQKTD